MINKKLASTLAFSIPKISLASSALEEQSIGITAKFLSTSKIDSSISLMLKQQEKLASTLAFSIPKISLASSALEEQSMGITANFLSMTKIDAQVLESFYTDEKIVTYQNDIKILNDKIQSKELFTVDDWKIYFNIVKELFYIFVALISIHAFISPDNIEIKKLQKEFNILASSIQNETYYEVVRTVRIREYPNSLKGTKILDVVYPGQKLLLLDRKSKWIEIEYFNEKKQETITGWVYKKYTKKL